MNSSILRIACNCRLLHSIQSLYYRLEIWLRSKTRQKKNFIIWPIEYSSRNRHFIWWHIKMLYIKKENWKYEKLKSLYLYTRYHYVGHFQPFLFHVSPTDKVHCTFLKISGPHSQSIWKKNLMTFFISKKQYNFSYLWLLFLCKV